MRQQQKQVSKFCTGLSLLLLTYAMVWAGPKPIVEELAGKVVGVSDGDTIKVLTDELTVTVRLEGIDAPESGQSFGKKSKDSLAELLAGKMVTVKKTGTDRYGRALGYVFAGDIEANATMVESGLAWHFTKYNDEERLAKLESAARKARKGLWADPEPLAPWSIERVRDGRHLIPTLWAHRRWCSGLIHRPA